jgi:hypothetical protein
MIMDALVLPPVSVGMIDDPQPSMPYTLSCGINLGMRIVDAHLAGGGPIGRVVSASIGADFRARHLVHALEGDRYAAPRRAF